MSRAVGGEMNDREYRLEPEVRVRQCDTVRFDVRNSGMQLHALVIGTSHELKEHASQPADDSDADHDQTCIVHVQPGARETLVW